MNEVTTMQHFLDIHHHVQETKFQRTDHVVIDAPGNLNTFIEHAATFFINKWMELEGPDMHQVRADWDCCTDDLKERYKAYLERGLLAEGVLNDTPDQGHTGPIATFAETMLRWFRESFEPAQLLIEPPVPKPPGEGLIDFIEITGFPGDYSSMRVTLWEIKASDNQISGHNDKIYKQLNDYPRRFFTMANDFGHRGKKMVEEQVGADMALVQFLRDVGDIVRNRRHQAQYGVFLVYDSNLQQDNNPVPGLHKHPTNCPEPHNTHFLCTLLIPEFKQLRLNVWSSLRLL
jgi:hypothetical protein